MRPRITSVKVELRGAEWGSWKATAWITLEGPLTVGGFKVMDGVLGLLVSMPWRKLRRIRARAIAGPLTHAYRDYIEETILTEYRLELHRRDGDFQDAGARAWLRPPMGTLSGAQALPWPPEDTGEFEMA
jgi:DNA-binding cell septation regulator SpoVG